MLFFVEKLLGAFVLLKFFTFLGAKKAVFVHKKTFENSTSHLLTKLLVLKILGPGLQTLNSWSNKYVNKARNLGSLVVSFCPCHVIHILWWTTNSGFTRLIPRFFGLSDETLNQGPFSYQT